MSSGGCEVERLELRVKRLETTDFTDNTDVNHERKRAYPFNLCNLCSK